MKLYFFQADAKWGPFPKHYHLVDHEIWEKGNKIVDVHCNSGLFCILPLATLILIAMEYIFMEKHANQFTINNIISFSRGIPPFHYTYTNHAKTNPKKRKKVNI